MASAPDPFTLHTLDEPSRGVKAKGYYSGELSEGKGGGKFVVMEDSLVYKEYSTRDIYSYVKTHKDLREKLLKEGFLHENDKKTWRMVERYTFNSASQAASIVLGRNADDKEWENEHVPVPRLLDPLQQFEDQDRSLPQETEAEREVQRQRRGQTILRERLIRRYRKCQITNISDEEMLIVSHIKPWRDCDNNEEKMDLNNCLLLYASWDKAFDRGKVTFDSNGQPIFSDCLSQECRDNLLYRSNFPIKITPEQQKYMEYHREKVFLSQKT